MNYVELNLWRPEKGIHIRRAENVSISHSNSVLKLIDIYKHTVILQKNRSMAAMACTQRRATISRVVVLLVTRHLSLLNVRNLGRNCIWMQYAIRTGHHR